MAKRTQHTIGLDIGTSRVTCIACEPGEGGLLNIVGIGEAEARGLRKGVIVNPDAAVDAIKKAVEEAERMSGIQAEEVTINLAGSHILGLNGQAIELTHFGCCRHPHSTFPLWASGLGAMHAPTDRRGTSHQCRFGCPDG